MRENITEAILSTLIIILNHLKMKVSYMKSLCLKCQSIRNIKSIIEQDMEDLNNNIKIIENVKKICL